MTKGITQAEAVEKMDDIPSAKVKKAWNLARNQKSSGRLNLADIQTALGTINDQIRKAKHALKSDKAYSGSKFLERREGLMPITGSKKAKKRAYGGSMGGGMNPRGYSKDPTVESIVGYNPNRMNQGGVAGRLAKRGYGKARS